MKDVSSLPSRFQLNNGGSPQWVRVCSIFFSLQVLSYSYIYLHIGWGISLNFSGTRPRKRKERIPVPTTPFISILNFFFSSLTNVSLARVVGDLWLFVPPSIRRLFSLSLFLRQQLPISELFDCLTFSFPFLSFRTE